jgi:hypothetical protein
LGDAGKVPNSGAYNMTPGGAGSENHNTKSSFRLSFRKEESSFLKKRSKRLSRLSTNYPARIGIDGFSGEA